MAFQWNLGIDFFNSCITSQVQCLFLFQLKAWCGFVAVVFPIKHSFISTKVRIISIISTWLFAGVLNIPRSLTLKFVQSGNNMYCLIIYPEDVFPNQEAITAYTWLQATLVPIAPLFLTTVLYSAIAIALARQNIEPSWTQHIVRNGIL